MENNKSEFIESFKKRTKKLATDVIYFSQKLPKSEEATIIKKQLLRSATSSAANYRVSCRARSAAESYAKISLVIEEADETLFWLELLTECGMVTESTSSSLMKEVTEIVSVMVKARKNTQR